MAKTFKPIKQSHDDKLRDHFADTALAGIMNNPNFAFPRDGDLGGFPVKVATWCYQIADAMLAEKMNRP